MSNKNPYHSGYYMISSLFAEFQVSSEQQLVEKLEKESHTLNCICCGKEYPINKFKFVDGNPICKKCNCGS